MCFHQDNTGRENDSEHKTGNIFANAASVLSMAAEEISLDDHLEKELANEVELWRMETSSTAVHTNDGGYRTVFAPAGREDYRGNHSIDSTSALSSPDGGMDSDFDDNPESLGESRGRGSNDLACTGGRRRVAPGTREGTGLSTESSGISGLRPSVSTPVTESREVTTTSSLGFTGGSTAAGSGEDVRSGLIDGRELTGTGPFGQVPPQTPLSPQVDPSAHSPVPKVREGLATSVASSAGGPGRAVGVVADSAGGGAPGTPRTPLKEPATGSIGLLLGTSGQAAVSEEHPGTPPPISTAASPRLLDARLAQSGLQPEDISPRDDTVAALPLRGDTANTPSGEVPETDEALPNETSDISSSEDSFPGFIEDPLEKEMQAPAIDDIMHNYKEQRAVGLEVERREELVKPSPNGSPGTIAALSGLEGVRSDRSVF